MGQVGAVYVCCGKIESVKANGQENSRQYLGLFKRRD